MKVIGLYNDVYFQKKPRLMPKKLWEVICSRANPRTFQYMKELFEQSYPGGKILDEYEIPADVDKVVILYPDAIGLGQFSLEAQLRKQSKKIFVINGRRRFFALTTPMRFKLNIRRFLESSLLIELLCAPFVLLYIIGVTLIDKAKGCS
jgi:hypothetical protein